MEFGEKAKSESSTDNSEEVKSEIENEEGEFSEDEIESIISEALDSLKDKELLNGVNSILSRISNNKKRNGSAMNAYSGRFDVRSTLRDDCKFFVQANRTGHIKQFSKTHLNLFIDVSGSFCKHQTTTNSLLYALKEFEKQNTNFEFDVVVMQVGERLLDRDHREIECGGGNWLDDEIKDIFKKLQFGGYDNYNIVLFDGNALTDYWLGYDKAEAIKNFKAFDVSNCTFISDFKNERYVNSAKCKSMKTIFTADYVNEFKKNIFKALQNMTM